MGNVGIFITLLCNVLQAFVSPPCSFAPSYDLLAINRVHGAECIAHGAKRKFKKDIISGIFRGRGRW